MNMLTLNVIVGEDRQITIDVPSDIPTGTVEVTIRTLEPIEGGVPSLEMTRERVRALLAAGGILSTASYAPSGAKPLGDDEREELGRLFSAPVDTSVLISEDRGKY